MSALLCGCTRDGTSICPEHKPMNDYAPVKIYGGPRSNYELVYFEERRQWFIRCSDRNSSEQCYSNTGYDSKQEAAKAFEGTITYVSEAPGRS